MRWPGWYNSLFRSGRAKKLVDLANKNRIIFDTYDHSWISSSGKRCVLIDDDHNVTSISNKIIDFIQKKSLTDSEQFSIILIDLDNEPIIKLPYDECRDPQPHIHVYNLLENVDAQAVLNEFSNRSIYLLDGFYGSCRRKFNCYSQSKYTLRQVNNVTPICQHSRLCVCLFH